MNKCLMARLLLLSNGMTTPKILAWMVAIAVLATSSIALAAPTWLAVIYNKDQRTVLMRMTPVPGATGYKVMRSETAGGGYEEIGTTKVPMYKDNTAEAGVTYYYVFLAVTPGGEEQSDEKSITIPGRKKEKTPAPEWKSVTPTVRTTMGKQEAFVGLSWKQGQAQNTIGFNIYRSEISGGDYAMITSTGPGETSFIDNTVEVGKTYYYVMTALDQNLEETPYSKEGTAEVKAVEVEKKQRRPRKLKKPIPRTTEVVWRTWNVHPANEGKSPQAKMDQPTDIEYDPDKKIIYVVSSTNRNLAVLQSQDGKLVKYLGPDFGGYTLEKPHGMNVDKNGLLYVVDRGASTLVVLNGDGSLKQAIPIAQKDEPEKLRLFDVVALDDGRMFITDNANSKVIVLNSSGDEIDRWGEPGGEEKQLKFIGTIQKGKDGNLAVLNAFDGKIKIFTPEGEFITAFGERKPVVEGFSILTAFNILPDGQYLASDLGPHLVKQFDLNGEPREYQADLANSDGTGRAEISSPTHLVSDGKDRIFITEAMASQVTCLKLGRIIPMEEEE